MPGLKSMVPKGNVYSLLSILVYDTEHRGLTIQEVRGLL